MRRGRRPGTARLGLVGAGAALLLAVAASPALAFPVTAKPPGALEGAPFAGTVASFTDGFILGLGCLAPGQYSALITWGDGATSAGTVSGGVGMLVGGCLYAVDGAHTYAEEGHLTYSVAVTGGSSSGESGPTPLLVRDGALNRRATSFTANQGTAAAATVATFTDANPAAQPTDFSATITWGDGTSGAGAVAAAPGGGFAVTASHSYAHSGTFNFSVSLADAGGSQGAASTTATVVAASTTGQPPAGQAPGTTPPAPLRLGLSAPVLARGGTVVVAVRCPVAARVCRGRLKVTTVASPGSGLPALRAAQTLGTTLFLIPGGRRAELSVRPKRAVVALLRRAGSVKVSAAASSFDAATGRSQVASLTAKLKLAPGGSY